MYDGGTLTAKSTVSRLNETAEQRAEREVKLAGAVRTLLEAIGEDPDREGLVKTPERYAKALLWMTRGYEERLQGNVDQQSSTWKNIMKLQAKRDTPPETN